MNHIKYFIILYFIFISSWISSIRPRDPYIICFLPTFQRQIHLLLACSLISFSLLSIPYKAFLFKKFHQKDSPALKKSTYIHFKMEKVYYECILCAHILYICTYLIYTIDFDPSFTKPLLTTHMRDVPKKSICKLFK